MYTAVAKDSKEYLINKIEIDVIKDQWMRLNWTHIPSNSSSTGVNFFL